MLALYDETLQMRAYVLDYTEAHCFVGACMRACVRHYIEGVITTIQEE